MVQWHHAGMGRAQRPGEQILQQLADLLYQGILNDIRPCLCRQYKALC